MRRSYGKKADKYFLRVSGLIAFSLVLAVLKYAGWPFLGREAKVYVQTSID